MNYDSQTQQFVLWQLSFCFLCCCWSEVCHSVTVSSVQRKVKGRAETRRGHSLWGRGSFYFWFPSRVLLENGGFALAVRAPHKGALVIGSVKVCSAVRQIEMSYERHKVSLYKDATPNSYTLMMTNDGEDDVNRDERNSG